MADEVLKSALDKVSDICKKHEKLLVPQKKTFEAAKLVTKVIYDLVKVSEDSLDQDRDTLSELVIEDFDQEQVWAGIELQNKAKLDNLLSKINALSRNENFNLLLGFNRKRTLSDSAESEAKRVKFDTDVQDDEDEDDFTLNGNEEEESERDDEDEEEQVEEEEDDVQGDEDADSILDDPDFQNMSDSDLDDLPLFDKEYTSEEESEEEEEGDDDNDNDNSERKKRKIDADTKAEEYLNNAMKALRGNKSAVDDVEDRFFKLKDMEQFLDEQDAFEEKRRLREEKGIDNDDESEDDGIDMFDDIGDGDQDDGRALYKDYFEQDQSTLDNQVDPAEEEEDDDDELQADEDNTQTTHDLLEESEDEAEDQENKSTFEAAQARLRKKIKAMEEDAVGEKPWQMTGEITGPARPENSLLQEHLEYDSAAKQAPIITEEVSKTLENIILQRIKDKAWDDVERKVKPAEDPFEYKKKLVLDSEKSKLSLAEIYEQEYLQQQAKLEESKKVPGMLDHDSTEIPKEVEEIRRNMKKLFAKLDTLTHFHFTPKNLSAEVKIVKNMPSIAMEDVAPVAVSDATLLAPQEVTDTKKGEMIGQSERTETDKKRQRRQKKAKQRAVQKEKEQRQKVVDRLNPGLGNKYSKKKMMEDLKDQEKKGKLTTIKEKDKSKAVKSSTAFFNQLQHESALFVKEKKGDRSGAKSSMKSASSLKL